MVLQAEECGFVGPSVSMGKWWWDYVSNIDGGTCERIRGVETNRPKVPLPIRGHRTNQQLGLDLDHGDVAGRMCIGTKKKEKVVEREGKERFGKAKNEKLRPNQSTKHRGTDSASKLSG
jgi:hypothetical protein